MGKPMGSTEHKKNISMLTPEQQAQYSSTLQNVGPGFNQALQSAISPMSQEDMQSVFQQTYVDPALKALQQQILPAVQQRYVDANAGTSSALNQALSQSATDVATQLGSQYGNFMQNQQNRQLQAMGLYQPLLTNQTFTPIIQQKEGWLPMLLAQQAKIAGAAASGAGGF